MERWTRCAILTAVVAANLPDIDIAFALLDPAWYLQYHRGLTHALIGIPFLSVLLTAAVHRVSLFRDQLPARFWPLLGISLLTMLTHPLLDYTNTYGVRPFLPFNAAWYYGDVVFVIDPIIDAILLAALVAGFFLKRRHRALRAAALGLVIVYVGARMELRDRARQQLAEFTSGLEGFERSFVSPQMMNPFLWTGLVETAAEVLRVQIDVRKGTSAPSMRIRRLAESEITRSARRTRSAAVFLDFARFPLARVYRLEKGYRVVYVDFRYYRPNPGTSFGAEVILDENLNVIRDNVRLSQSVRLSAGP